MRYQTIVSLLVCATCVARITASPSLLYNLKPVSTHQSLSKVSDRSFILYVKSNDDPIQFNVSAPIGTSTLLCRHSAHRNKKAKCDEFTETTAEYAFEAGTGHLLLSLLMVFHDESELFHIRAVLGTAHSHLKALEVLLDHSNLKLDPPFAPDITSYKATIPFVSRDIVFHPVSVEEDAMIVISRHLEPPIIVQSGHDSDPRPVDCWLARANCPSQNDSNHFTITVTSVRDAESTNYELLVVREGPIESSHCVNKDGFKTNCTFDEGYGICVRANVTAPAKCFCTRGLEDDCFPEPKGHWSDTWSGRVLVFIVIMIPSVLLSGWLYGCLKNRQLRKSGKAGFQQLPTGANVDELADLDDLALDVPADGGI